MSYPSSELWASDPVLTPERRIWRGVLEQAYVDAESSPEVEAENEDVLFIEQIRARRFLRADTPGEKEELRLVCDYAEIPFDRVVTWARRHYAPSAQRDLERVEAKDAKEVEEIVKAVNNREAIRRSGSSEFPCTREAQAGVAVLPSRVKSAQAGVPVLPTSFTYVC